MEWFKLWTTI